MSLCLGCSRAVIMRGSLKEILFLGCHALSDGEGVVEAPKDVEHCSEFSDPNEASLYDMRMVAWSLNTDKGRNVGFSPPTNRKEANETLEDMASEKVDR